ncbi:helix-turn-helix domain-containing protein [Serratia liquefaciens]|uniref:helix-turn-helix domain-containing protein n=2 Tax=Serratia TaxID=613 RepID=UPI0028F7478D|nr:helix-turn-helix domain-containing protein [Serratia liquefaciens]
MANHIGLHVMTGKKRGHDWHRADVVAEVRKKGTSLSALGRKNGLSSHTLKNALDKHYPHAEVIIATAIGLNPEDIWPSRYGQMEG